MSQIRQDFQLVVEFEFYENLILEYWMFLPILKNLKLITTASANIKKQEGSYFDTFF